MSTVSILHQALRREVGLLRARESRRIFDTLLYVGPSVGRPAGLCDSFVVRAQDLPAMDAALRTDVVSALVGEVVGGAIGGEIGGEIGGAHTTTGGLSMWLTRAGTNQPHDEDFLWYAAARVAFGQHAVPLLGFFVITRSGWLDLGTGEHRTWKRLRL